MLRNIFLAACMQHLSQRLFVEVAIDRRINFNSLVRALFVVSHDQARNEFAKENGTSITENSSILLRSMSLYSELRVRDNATLKHNRSRLVYGNSLVSQAGIVIGHSTIAVDNWLLAFARIDLLDVLAQFFVQFLLLLLPEEFLVYQSYRLGHGLNHLLV